MFSPNDLTRIRNHWAGRVDLVGRPDAEKDISSWPAWEANVFLKLPHFQSLCRGQTQLIIGRKGSGKTASLSAAKLSVDSNTLDLKNSAKRIIVADAAKLVDSAINEFNLRDSMGTAAVAIWYKVFAAEILRSIAADLSGEPLLKEAEISVRKWALSEGFVAKDFGEKIVSGLQQLFPEIRKRTVDGSKAHFPNAEHVEELLCSSDITLFVDNFDNPGSATGRDGSLGTDLAQAAIEAADMLSAAYESPNISLFIREDLWLRCRIGWHYLDKVTLPQWLLWTPEQLQNFTKTRLAVAASIALKEDPTSRINESFNDLWSIFFPPSIKLENGAVSQGFTYVLRRTMYTPRDLQTFLQMAINQTTEFPLKESNITYAENSFSTDRLQYLINEFGDLCKGLAECLHSFSGHSLEWKTSDLRTHLNGMVGQGRVAPTSAACADTRSIDDLMRFLFRIGFLEVRLTGLDGKAKDEGWEVRDGLRHPDHWNGARVDDSVRWAVRSTFFQALRSYQLKQQGSGWT